MFALAGPGGGPAANIIGGTVRGLGTVLPAMADDVPAAGQVIDVREIEGEPFDDIMTALDELGEDERLRLTAEFEPVPLYGVLEGKGFEHETSQVDDVYHVLIQSA